MSDMNQLNVVKTHKHQIANAILGLELALKEVAPSNTEDELIQEIDEYIKTITNNWKGCQEVLRGNLS